MKEIKLKRILVIALSVVMVTGMFSLFPQGTGEAYADTAAVKNVNLGTAVIGNPTSTASTATAWAGSKVYYAGKECYVLDKDGSLTGGFSSQNGNMLLLTKDIIGSYQFMLYFYYSGDWSKSVIRSNLNNSDSGFLSMITAVEQNSLTPLSISADNMSYAQKYKDYNADTTNDKVFLLDLKDVQNSTYGFSNNDTRKLADDNSEWWLRSPDGCFESAAAFVLNTGELHHDTAICDYTNVEDWKGARPAFNLNLDSVLLTTAVGTSKSTFAAVGNEQASANDTWKLTLKDGNNGFDAVRTDKGNYAAGTDVKVYVKSLGTAPTGVEYNAISGILTDDAGTVLCYGKAEEEFGTGTGHYTFKIPAGVTDGTKFYVFAESVSQTSADAKTTDYASNMKEPVYEDPKTVSVTNPAGSHITRSTASGNGAENQNGIYADMTSVVYTADDGYCFPADYTVAAVNGVTVTRNSAAQITVSGTPTADAAITLAPAVEKVISLGVTAPSFDSAAEGYTSRPEAKNITIANGAGSNCDAAVSSVTLTGTDKDAFEVSGSGMSWTVQPKSGLTANADRTAKTYTATVSVAYDATSPNVSPATADVSFTVTPKPVNVTVENPADSHITKTSGEETQSSLTGAMTSVVYTADDGYCFPSSYTVATVNGVTVTRNSDTQITVSGTPTADTNLILEPAVKKIVSPAKYPITIGDGTDAGSYAAGDKVTVTAGTAPEGKVFDKWQVVKGDIIIEDLSSENASFIMPYGEVEIIPVYKDIPGAGFTSKAIKNSLSGYNDIRASWTKVEGAEGYKVYVKKAGAAKYTYKGSTVRTSKTIYDLSSGTKYYVKVVPYVVSSGNKVDGKAAVSSGIYTLKKLNAPTVKKSSAGKIRITWKNIYGESGYQISRSASKTKTGTIYTVKTTKGTSKILTAKKGRTYYYKVRSYKTVNGKKVYAPWSKVKAYKL